MNFLIRLFLLLPNMSFAATPLICERYIVFIKTDMLKERSCDTTLDSGSEEPIEVIQKIIANPNFEILDKTTSGNRILALLQPIGSAKNVALQISKLQNYEGVIVDCERGMSFPD